MVHFGTYELQIVEPTAKKTRDKSIASLTYGDLKKLLREESDDKEYRKYLYEWHNRFALSFACILFVLVGIGLGCRTNNRTGKSGGGVISVAVIVAYWILFVIGNNLIQSPWSPIWFAAWLPAIVLLPAGLFLLRRNWN